MYNPWTEDADNIREMDQLQKMTLYETEFVRDFLSRQTYYYFLTAPRGFGKTYLLLAKRNDYQKIRAEQLDSQGIKIIPSDALRDLPLGNVTLNKKVIDFLAKDECIDVLWGLSIVFSCLRISSLKKDLDANGNELAKEFLNCKSQSPFSYFQRFLDLLKEDTRKFFRLHREYNVNLMDWYRDIHQSIIMFLDDMDDNLDIHIDRNRNALGIKVPEIWVNAQISLLRVATQLMRSNHHIRIYVAIREEAYSKLFEKSTDSMLIEAKTIHLKYSKQQLKNMFIAHIRNEESEKLKEPTLRIEDPIKAFLGTSSLKNANVLPQTEEDIFELIYRHSLGRPREIVAFGHELRRLNIAERNSSQIIARIEKCAKGIVSQYINELQCFEEIDIQEFLKNIDCNVMTQREVLQVCAKGNKLEQCEGQCDNCSQFNTSNILDVLYRQGLMGYVSCKEGKPIQIFLSRNLMSADSRRAILPKSEYYLIHPALSQWIKEQNDKFVMDGVNVVGNGYKWIENEIHLNLIRSFTQENGDRVETELRNLERQEPKISRLIDSFKNHDYRGIFNVAYNIKEFIYENAKGAAALCSLYKIVTSWKP